MACKNPFLEAERARKRESLLAATEADLAKIAAAARGNAGRCAARTRSRCAPTGCCAAARSPSTSPPSISDDHFSYARNQDSITAEAALDGIYVLRTSVEPGDLASSEVVSSYKALAQVERAFRAFNTDLDIRPIRHRTETRVRAHVFLRMLSYYITWHMHDRLAPLLFTDDDKPAAQAARPSPVAPAARSPRALAKAAAKRTEGDLPVHSFDQPAGRPGHHLPQPDPARRPRPARLPARHHPHPPAAPGPRPARRQPPPRHRVVRSPPPPPQNPR